MHYQGSRDPRLLTLTILSSEISIFTNCHFRRKEDTEVAVERRYQGEYENRLDPFQSFSQSERKRKYGQLSVAEKVRINFILCFNLPLDAIERLYPSTYPLIGFEALRHSRLCQQSIRRF